MQLFIAFLILVALALLLARFSPLRFRIFSDPLARGDVYGTQATKLQASPPQKIGVIDRGARIRYLNEVYTQGAADGTIGDVIHLPDLPVGSKIIASLSTVNFSAGNAGATLAIGKTGAATALKAATSIAAQGSFSLTEPVDGADDVTLGTDEQLIATNATAAIKAAQSIRFRIAYVENS